MGAEMKRLMALAAIASLAGCATVESEDVATSGVYADIKASADGSGVTQVRASLRVGGGTSNTFLDLSGDDRLETTHGQDTQSMAREELLGAVSYVTSFPVEAADSQFVVAFHRTIDEGAPSSTAVLPAPFAISAPAAETTFSRTSDVTVTWSPSATGDAMTWVANGDCVAMRLGNIAGDPGSLVIPAGTFVAHDG